MMKIILLLPVIFFACIIPTEVHPSKINDYKFYDDKLKWAVIENGLYTRIKNKQFIYYRSGHNGWIWSILLKENNKYSVLSGGVGLAADDSPIPFDTVNVIKANLEIIEWGFDSLSYPTKKIHSIITNEYNPIYSEMSIFNSDGNEMFFTANNYIYVGTDSAIFTNKLNKLEYLMMWFASSELRQYLPVPSLKIYSNTTNSCSK